MRWLVTVTTMTQVIIKENIHDPNCNILFFIVEIIETICAVRKAQWDLTGFACIYSAYRVLFCAAVGTSARGSSYGLMLALAQSHCSGN